jgi:hypothetical protein
LLVAAIVYPANAVDTIPVAVVALVMAGLGALTVTESVAEPEPLALAAVIVTLVTPTAVGVPEITPLLAFRVSPAGRVVEL